MAFVYLEKRKGLEIIKQSQNRYFEWDWNKRVPKLCYSRRLRVAWRILILLIEKIQIIRRDRGDTRNMIEIQESC